METYQKNIHVEGTLGSNSLIEGLNTKIFKDIGNGNDIIIDMKGYKNGKSNLDIANSYDFIKDIPIQIRKNGDSTENAKLTFQVSNLTKVNLAYKDKNGQIQNDFPNLFLKDKDKITVLIKNHRLYSLICFNFYCAIYFNPPIRFIHFIIIF